MLAASSAARAFGPVVSVGSAAPKMVVVFPSTRTLTRTASAGAASAENRAATAARMMSRRNTNPPSARGSGLRRRGRSSDSGLPPPPPSQPEGQWSRRRSNSPHSGGTVPDSHRVPLPRAVHSTLSWPDAGSAGALALAARRRLGRRHLRFLIGAAPDDRPRLLGHAAAQGGAFHGIRDPRSAAPARARARAARVR